MQNSFFSQAKYLTEFYLFDFLEKSGLLCKGHFYFEGEWEMNKFLIPALAVGLFFGSALSARAGMYVSAGIGYAKNKGDVKFSNVKEDYKSSSAYSIALGYDLPVVPLRFEGEFFSNSAKVEHTKKHVRYNALMGNAYLNLPFPIVSPYVGAGVGYVRLKGDNVSAWQGMVGVETNIPLVPLKGGLEYRYISSDEAKKSGVDYEYKTHVIMAKIRLEF